MKILVLNGGSSSHKLCLYNIAKIAPEPPPPPIWEAQIDWYPHQSKAVIAVKTKSDHAKESKEVLLTSRRETLAQVVSTLWQGKTQVIQNSQIIDAIGHRVVHGGQNYQSSVVVTAEVKASIAQLIPLAPIHNRINLEGIELMEQLLEDIPQVAVFDTAFHSQIPDPAAIYPGPYHWVEQGIRRYGFHGISHQYCAHRAAQILNRDLSELRLIVCHLGNGSSLSAVQGGKSIDTTMGFTPLDGLMMGTRAGAIDPGILIYLMRQGYSADQLDQLLNQESGLKGISGISHDLREIEAAIAQGHPQARLALDIYLHRLKSCIGSMLMSLGGVDAIVFTAGIGEHSATVRALTCESLGFLGLRIDPDLNANSPVDQDIATSESTARVLVIHTQEDWAIAQSSWRCLTNHG